MRAVLVRSLALVAVLVASAGSSTASTERSVLVVANGRHPWSVRLATTSIGARDIDPGQLVGQNLGYAYAHLPNLASLLVSREVVEQTDYDLVIDTKGRCGGLTLKAGSIIDLKMLDGRARQTGA